MRTKTGCFIKIAIVNEMARLRAICDDVHTHEDDLSDASNDLGLYDAIISDPSFMQDAPESHPEPYPNWVTAGKTISHLINELNSFEDQSLEVRIAFDDGYSHRPISFVGRNGAYCLLVNCEAPPPETHMFRVLELHDETLETVHTVTVHIAAPILRGDGNWQCSYRISGLSEVSGRWFSVLGADSVQALLLAFPVIESLLAGTSAAKQGRLRWENRCYGFLQPS